MVKENQSEHTSRTPGIAHVIFFMDVADLKEFLGQIPIDKRVKIQEKMLESLSEYHRKCHEARVILTDQIDSIIRSVDQ
jgi:hypothetical protein